MVLWITLATFLLVGGIIIGFCCSHFEIDYLAFVSLAFLSIAITILLISICTRCEYIQFEKEFEITRIQAELLLEEEDIKPKQQTLLVLDLLDANEKLAMYQGARTTWGKWSNIPERVFSIKPIGIK